MIEIRKRQKLKRSRIDLQFLHKLKRLPFLRRKHGIRITGRRRITPAFILQIAQDLLFIFQPDHLRDIHITEEIFLLHTDPRDRIYIIQITHPCSPLPDRLRHLVDKRFVLLGKQCL